MEYQDWYERYQNAKDANAGGGNDPYGKRRNKKNRSGVGIGTVVICMLLAALIGGSAGGYLTARYIGDGVPDETAMQTAVDSAVADAMTAYRDNAALAQANTMTSPAETIGASQMTKAQIIERCAPSVVGIDVEYPVSGYGYWGGQQTATGSGSGIIVSSDGYIVTCKHVVENASRIKVVLNDDSEHEATLIGSDNRYDLAVIKIEGTGLAACTLGDSDMLTVGEDVIAIGNPLGELRGTATSGMVSALNRSVTVETVDMTLIQTDAAISPGNSGGGLFNSSGTLIGIVNAKAGADNAEGLGFAIPVSSVREIIADLVDLGYVSGRAYLGVQTQNVTVQSEYDNWGGFGGFFGSFYNPGSNCVQVVQVIAGSAADKAGIKANDLILAVGEAAVTSNSDLSAAIGAYNAGDTATLTIQRDGQKQEVSVTFDEYKPQS